MKLVTWIISVPCFKSLLPISSVERGVRRVGLQHVPLCSYSTTVLYRRCVMRKALGMLLAACWTTLSSSRRAHDWITVSSRDACHRSHLSSFPTVSRVSPPPNCTKVHSLPGQECSTSSDSVDFMGNTFLIFNNIFRIIFYILPCLCTYFYGYPKCSVDYRHISWAGLQR